MIEMLEDFKVILETVAILIGFAENPWLLAIVIVVWVYLLTKGKQQKERISSFNNTPDKSVETKEMSVKDDR